MSRVRSSLNYMSGLQPSSSTLNLHLGLRPRLVCHGPSALFECDELMTHDTRAFSLFL